MPKDYFRKHYEQLVGKTVKDVVFDAAMGYEFYGLRFTDLTTAWIACDPEGNEPGFLEINTPKGKPMTPA